MSRRIDVDAYEIRLFTIADTILCAAVGELPGCVASATTQPVLRERLERAIDRYVKKHPEAQRYYL